MGVVPMYTCSKFHKNLKISATAADTNNTLLLLQNSLGIHTTNTTNRNITNCHRTMTTATTNEQQCFIQT